MDIHALMNQAESAGLRIEAQGDRLVIKGPKRAAAIAQELGRQTAAVLAMLSAKAISGSTGRQDSEATADAGPKSEEDQSGRPCPTGRSTRQSWHPSKTAPATITHDGKSYAVAFTSGMWFFCRAPEAGWTACSDEFAAIVEERLQRLAIANNKGEVIY